MRAHWIDVVLAGLLTAAASVAAEPVVGTDLGPVAGELRAGVARFLGVPFAAAPTADRRFVLPTSPAPWTVPLPVLDWPPPCPQVDDDGRPFGDEGCLYLNLWAPEDAAGAPVLVFLHGGGHVQGSSSVSSGFGSPLYDGERVARRGGVVVITVQYRLGALGFVAHPALAAVGAGGNLGLADQQLALEWVGRNVAAFGGDPERVLLFGESAGAVDTCLHLTAPGSTGLFSAALIESGGCRAEPLGDAFVRGRQLATAVGCEDDALAAACLRAVPASELVTALAVSPIVDGLVQPSFGPMIDGVVLREDPVRVIAAGRHHAVPTVVGVNADEMLATSPALGPIAYRLAVTSVLAGYGRWAVDTALVLYPVAAFSDGRHAWAALTTDAQFVCPARRLARVLAAAHEEPVWRYLFSATLDGPLLFTWGAFHGLELWFVFQHLDELPPLVGSPADHAVEAAILDAWTTLAATGDPGPAWPRYQPASDPFLELGDEIAPGAGLRSERCDFWDALAVRPRLRAPRAPRGRVGGP